MDPWRLSAENSDMIHQVILHVFIMVHVYLSFHSWWWHGWPSSWYLLFNFIQIIYIFFFSSHDPHVNFNRLPLATAATASNEWIYKLCPLIPSFRISSFLSNSKDNSIPVTWVHQWLHLTNSTKKSGEKKTQNALAFSSNSSFLATSAKIDSQSGTQFHSLTSTIMRRWLSKVFRLSGV